VFLTKDAALVLKQHGNHRRRQAKL